MSSTRERSSPPSRGSRAGTQGSGGHLRLPKYGSQRIVFLALGLVDLLAAHVAAHTLLAESCVCTGRGLAGVQKPLSCGFRQIHTLKRNVPGVFGRLRTTTDIAFEQDFYRWPAMAGDERF